MRIANVLVPTMKIKKYEYVVISLAYTNSRRLKFSSWNYSNKYESFARTDAAAGTGKVSNGTSLNTLSFTISYS